MWASWGATMLLWDPLTVWVVVLGMRCGWVVLGDWSNLWGEAPPCSEARPGMVGEVLEQQRGSVGIRASWAEEPSDIFSNHWRLSRWYGRGPVVEAGQRG